MWDQVADAADQPPPTTGDANASAPEALCAKNRAKVPKALKINVKKEFSLPGHSRLRSKVEFGKWNRHPGHSI
jgi:hypothetical protein